jgi:hypothetical protein
VIPPGAHRRPRPWPPPLDPTTTCRARAEVDHCQERAGVAELLVDGDRACPAVLEQRLASKSSAAVVTPAPSPPGWGPPSTIRSRASPPLGHCRPPPSAGPGQLAGPPPPRPTERTSFGLSNSRAPAGTAAAPGEEACSPSHRTIRAPPDSRACSSAEYRGSARDLAAASASTRCTSSAGRVGLPYGVRAVGKPRLVPGRGWRVLATSRQRRPRPAPTQGPGRGAVASQPEEGGQLDEWTHRRRNVRFAPGRGETVDAVRYRWTDFH